MSTRYTEESGARALVATITWLADDRLSGAGPAIMCALTEHIEFIHASTDGGLDEVCDALYEGRDENLAGWAQVVRN